MCVCVCVCALLSGQETASKSSDCCGKLLRYKPHGFTASVITKGVCVCLCVAVIFFSSKMFFTYMYCSFTVHLFFFFLNLYDLATFIRLELHDNRVTFTTIVSLEICCIVYTLSVLEQIPEEPQWCSVCGEEEGPRTDPWGTPVTSWCAVDPPPKPPWTPYQWDRIQTSKVEPESQFCSDCPVHVMTVITCSMLYVLIVKAVSL